MVFVEQPLASSGSAKKIVILKITFRKLAVTVIVFYYPTVKSIHENKAKAISAELLDLNLKV